jgi:hypothetical protein
MRTSIVTLLLAAFLTACGDKKEEPAAPDTQGQDMKKVMEDAEEGAKEAGDEAMKALDDAKMKLADAMKKIKAGSLDEAKGLLEELNAIKDDLSDDLKQQLDAAWSAVKAKEAAGGMGIK